MASQEVQGSRQEGEDGRFKTGIMLFIGDAPSDAPAIGGYFTDAADNVESALTGRMCVQVKKDPETLPGIWLFTAFYRAFKAYA